MVKKTRISGFTLIEVLVSVMLTGIILTSAYSAFQGIMKSQIRLGGTIDIQRNLFYLNEKLATLIRGGGTIDYEEYFNRRILKYERGSLTSSGTNVWTFKTASKYGNGSGTNKPTLFLCGKSAFSDHDACLGADAVYASPIIRSTTSPFAITNSAGTISGQQAYRQYREIAFDYSSQLSTPTKLPSIFPIGGAEAVEGIPELYLIKKLPDGSYERVYFRHVFAQDPSPNTAQCADPTTNTKGCIGKLQMTKLKSCDIVGNDGIVDAWIPEVNFSNSVFPINCGQVVNYGDAINTLAWVDISSPDMHISRALFLPKPFKIPSLMAGTGEIAQSPSIQIRLEVQFSESLLRRGMMTQEANDPRILITTFDLPDL